MAENNEVKNEALHKVHVSHYLRNTPHRDTMGNNLELDDLTAPGASAVVAFFYLFILFFTHYLSQINRKVAVRQSESWVDI